MIKMLIGAAIVIALVGYGVVTPETLEDAGAKMKQGINNSASWVKEKTDPDTYDKVKDILEK